jgi:crotonobetainyl-CoA:carnitine CoA-transferase CaiB-like acyl-CoA transferase
MDYAVNERVQSTRGNTHPDMAVHGVYACAGTDHWIALAVTTESQWQQLCAAMGDPSWAHDERFSDAQERGRRRAELDAKISAWTSTRNHLELMAELQARRIPAAAVHDAAEHARDPHWQARGMYQPTELPGYGVFPLLTSPWMIDGQRLSVRLPPPPLGGHNQEIFGELLGLSPSELAELAEQELIGDAPKHHEL